MPIIEDDDRAISGRAISLAKSIVAAHLAGDYDTTQKLVETLFDHLSNNRYDYAHDEEFKHELLNMGKIILPQ